MLPLNSLSSITNKRPTQYNSRHYSLNQFGPLRHAFRWIVTIGWSHENSAEDRHANFVGFWLLGISLVASLCWIAVPVYSMVNGTTISTTHFWIMLCAPMFAAVVSTLLIGSFHIYKAPGRMHLWSSYLLIYMALVVELGYDGIYPANSYMLMAVAAHTLLTTNQMWALLLASLASSVELCLCLKSYLGFSILPNRKYPMEGLAGPQVAARPLTLAVCYLLCAASRAHILHQRDLMQSATDYLVNQQSSQRRINAKMQKLVNRVFPDDVAKRLVSELTSEHTNAIESTSNRRQSVYTTTTETIVPLLARSHLSTICFADIANFTYLSSSVTPEQLVTTLNSLIVAIDKLCAEHRGVQKVKTIGDCYMAAAMPYSVEETVGAIERRYRSGSVTPVDDRDETDWQNASLDTSYDSVLYASELLTVADSMHSLVNKFEISNQPLRFRIGMAHGKVVSGVIGMSRLAFDLWGDTVNTASRMESTGLVGATQVTSQVYNLLQNHFDFSYRGYVDVKGKGPIETYIHVPVNGDTPPQSAPEITVEADSSSSVESPKPSNSSNRSRFSLITINTLPTPRLRTGTGHKASSSNLQEEQPLSPALSSPINLQSTSSRKSFNLPYRFPPLSSSSTQLNPDQLEME